MSSPRTDLRVPTRLEGVAMAAVYLVALVGPIAFTRFGGTIACLWIATGVLAPYLASIPLRRWSPVLAVAAALSILVTSTVGLGPVFAVPMAAIILTEAALIGLWLRRITMSEQSTLASFDQIALLLTSTVVISSVTGLIAAAMLHVLGGTPLLVTWFNWLAGHALGTITFAPFALLMLRGDAAAWWRDGASNERVEAAFICLILSVTAFAVFSQHAMPLLFVPILPVIVATFRVGRIGAAASIVILALIATVMTLRGEGPVALIEASDAFRVQFLQFYLASVVLTVLPAAADLRRRKEILERLEMSEARYRLVSENATDVVLNLDRRGMIRYISPSVDAFGGGYSAAGLIATNAIELVHPDDRWVVREVHAAALAAPGETHMVEYRGLMNAAPGGIWLESRVRAIETVLAGPELVCAIRDISKRKAVEQELTLAASTDPLTGLANRRSFNDALDALIGLLDGREGEVGCLAVFDIDYFKAINDAFGHDAGDRVLQRFAEIASAVTRAGDLVGRLGGEEFGVLLAGANEAQARAVCNRLREEFGATTVLAAGGAPIRATVSGGVARLTGDTSRIDAMRLADAALYDAKRQGRDRLVLAA